MIQSLRLAPLALLFALSPASIPAQQNGGAGLFDGSTDIGAALKGSSTYQAATGTYQLTGGGADMWGASDAFHFTWVPLSSDVSLAANIAFPSGAVPPMEKAVLIIRQGLDAQAAYADIAIHGDGHITMQYRRSSGAATEDATSTMHGATRLRIERKGDHFTASAGPADGTLVTFHSETIVLHDPVYVGIGVCAHDATALASIGFSDVKINPVRGAASGK